MNFIFRSLACFTLFAAGYAKAAESGKTPDLTYGTWSIPPASVSTADPINPEETRNPKPGFKKRDGSPQFDASEFIRAMGVSEIPGAEAVYDPSSGSLVVKSTKANLKTITSVLSYAGLASAPVHIVSEFSIFECVLPANANVKQPAWPSVAELATLQAKDVRLLDRLSVTSKSGERASLSQIVSSRTQNKNLAASDKPQISGPFTDGKFGTQAEVESVVSPDNMTIDTDISFRWRGKTSGSGFSEVRLDTNFSSWDGYPIVIHASKVENSPGQHLLVTAVSRLEAPTSWTLDSLSTVAKKVQEIEKAMRANVPNTEN